MAKSRTRLYGEEPKIAFNRSIKKWLEGSEQLVEHKTPAAFSGLLDDLKKTVDDLQKIEGLERKHAYKVTLSKLTDLMFGDDLTQELGKRLETNLINESGFRTTISQGVAKNVGENFVNAVVYSLSVLLEDNDEVLVDKGMPPLLKKAMTLTREVDLGSGKKTFSIPIEGDMAIFSRENPLDAIVISAKTRLKEVFHIGTMWKIFFDMINDQNSLDKWNLNTNDGADLRKTLYLFVTADMVKKGAKKSQGGDVERDEPRNLIAMDASFFDYVMVSKTGISHVSESLNLTSKKESLFHELGCLIDLIEQKFKIKL